MEHPKLSSVLAGMGQMCWAAGWRRGNFFQCERLPAVTQLLLLLPYEQMEKALANLALRTAEASAGEPVVSKASSPASTSSALKGVSQALLERVSNSVLAVTPVLGGPACVSPHLLCSPRSGRRRRRSCRR